MSSDAAMHDGIDPGASACQQDNMVVDFLMGSSNILMVAQQGVRPPPQSLSVYPRDQELKMRWKTTWNHMLLGFWGSRLRWSVSPINGATLSFPL